MIKKAHHRFEELKKYNKKEADKVIKLA